jgi:hypothetical protein
VRRALATALWVTFAALPLGAGEIPGAVLVLETAPGTPGSDPTGAPPRFVLLRDARVFVGGSSLVEAGRLEKGEAQALQKRASALRKIPGIGTPISFGGGSDRPLRLRLLEDEPIEIVVTGLPLEGGGDPAGVPPPLAELARLLQDLARFHHPSLRPFAPSSYSLTVREARLAGGCRAWSWPFPIADALAGPRAVPAADAASWPTGAMPASVCVDDRRYAVTLRPLLPGEHPPT